MSIAVENDDYPDEESEGFYSRWSKRKFQAQSHHPEEKQTATSENTNLLVDADGEHHVDRLADKQASAAEKKEHTLLCDKDMPDLDTLDEDSDYSGFLSPGVSEKLRKLALRKLFHGQSFKLCDGLDDYDEEFTSFEKLGDIVTADMRFQLEEEAKRKLQIAAAEDDISAENDDLALLDEVCSENELNESIPVPIVDETAEQEEHQLRNNDNLS